MTATKRPTARRTGGRPTREASADIEEQLRRAALTCFGTRGFAGTSMEEIARAANVSKPTLYARFPDKQTLFMQVIRWALKSQEDDALPTLDAVGTDGDIVTALTRVAMALRRRTLDPAIVQLLRVMISESAQFPELAMRAESIADSPRLQAAADIIRQQAAIGRIADADLAIAHFNALFGFQPMFLATVGLGARVDLPEADVRRSVEAFLDGVRPRR